MDAMSAQQFSTWHTRKALSTFCGGKLGKIKLRRQLGKVSVLGRSLFGSLPLTSPRERLGRTGK